MSFLKGALSLVIGLLVLEVFPSAQCPLPDKLDGGPCCTTAHPDVPDFPNFLIDSIEICWRDCNVDAVIPYRARWKKINLLPVPAPCGTRFMSLELFDPLGTLVWTGRLRLTYSRTWAETAPGPTPLQVWRFLVNGDMSPTLGIAPIPCPVPPCAPANGNRVRFTGYLDYARSCTPVGGTQHAWMLTHACDMIDHHPLFPRGGIFHPDRSYSFVGPSTGFAPGPLTPTEGTPGSSLEDVRRLDYPLPGTTGPVQCEFEEQITFGLLPQQQLCLCATGPALPQHLIARLDLAGVCGTSITTPGGPFLPGFISMGIGTWTLPGLYPGVERLRWNTGNYDYADPCIGVVRPEVFYGVTTIDGYPATQVTSAGVGLPLPPFFIDQANSLTAAGATIMNVPFQSNHILNLNH